MLLSGCYGLGAAIADYTPAEVDEMTVWELAAAADGVAKANGAVEAPPPMTGQEFRDIVAAHAPIARQQPGSRNGR